MAKLTPMCDYLICKNFVDICLDNCSETLKSLRIQAVMSISNYLHSYVEQGFTADLIEVVCHKKLQYISQASTKRDIAEIIKPQVPKWRAGEIVCDSPYHIVEEELMLWSIVSPYMKLTNLAEERCLYLFKEVFGCHPNDYQGETPLTFLSRK